jgi:hypothetical protein
MGQLLGIAAATILAIILFLIRKQRTALSDNPDVIWQVKGFAELRNRGFEILKAPVILERAENSGKTRSVRFIKKYQIGDIVSEVRISSNSLQDKGTIVTFHVANSLFATAKIIKAFFRSFDYTVSWQNSQVLIPVEGPIETGGRTIGRVGKYGVEEIVFIVVAKDIDPQLRGIIYCLRDIREFSDGVLP